MPTKAQLIKNHKEEIKKWKELYKNWEGEMTILRAKQKQHEANVRYLKREHKEENEKLKEFYNFWNNQNLRS